MDTKDPLFFRLRAVAAKHGTVTSISSLKEALEVIPIYATETMLEKNVQRFAQRLKMDQTFPMSFAHFCHFAHYLIFRLEYAQSDPKNTAENIVAALHEFSENDPPCSSSFRRESSSYISSAAQKNNKSESVQATVAESYLRRYLLSGDVISSTASGSELTVDHIKKLLVHERSQRPCGVPLLFPSKKASKFRIRSFREMKIASSVLVESDSESEKSFSTCSTVDVCSLQSEDVRDCSSCQLDVRLNVAWHHHKRFCMPSLQKKKSLPSSFRKHSMNSVARLVHSFHHLGGLYRRKSSMPEMPLQEKNDDVEPETCPKRARPPIIKTANFYPLNTGKTVECTEPPISAASYLDHRNRHILGRRYTQAERVKQLYLLPNLRQRLGEHWTKVCDYDEDQKAQEMEVIDQEKKSVNSMLEAIHYELTDGKEKKSAGSLPMLSEAEVRECDQEISHLKTSKKNVNLMDWSLARASERAQKRQKTLEVQKATIDPDLECRRLFATACQNKISFAETLREVNNRRQKTEMAHQKQVRESVLELKRKGFRV